MSLDDAALVYALRHEWSSAERAHLDEAKAVVQELVEAYNGNVPVDLRRFYGDEFERRSVRSRC